MVLEIESDDLYNDPALTGYYLMNVSKSTARRDLKKLTDLGLLEADGKKNRVSLACLRIWVCSLRFSDSRFV